MSFSNSVFQIACATGGRLCIVNCSDFCLLRSGLSRRGMVPILKKHETLVTGSLLALPLFNESVIYSI